MTVDEVRLACRDDIKEDIEANGKLIGFRLNGVKVGDTDLGVVFYLSSDSKYIRKVELTKLFFSSGRDQAYNAIKAMLVDKYGKPTTDDQNSDGTRSAQWLFPSTWITLGSFGTAGLEITYTAANKEAKDAL